ncbi:MAG: DinB family protein [Gemmatimonadaceae bacterium]
MHTPLSEALRSLGATTLPSDAPPYARRLADVVDRAVPALLAIGDDDSMRRLAPGKWSPREIIGHLIDSASNNHQRFVRMRTRDDLVVEGYQQDDWVSAQRYRESPWPELVVLWQLYNRHLGRVMSATPAADRERERDDHNLDQRAFRAVPRERPTTLEYLMADYLDHLEHHLSRVLG